MELRKFDEEEKHAELRRKFRAEKFDLTVGESDEFDRWPFDESVKLSVTFNGSQWHSMHLSFEEAARIADSLKKYLDSHERT